VREDVAMSRFVYRLNAAVDAGDMAATALPLVRRGGIDRAAAGTIAFAFTGSHQLPCRGAGACGGSSHRATGSARLPA
jgi:hypothetical protein